MATRTWRGRGRYYIEVLHYFSTCDCVIQVVARLLRAYHIDVNYYVSSLLRIQIPKKFDGPNLTMVWHSLPENKELLHLVQFILQSDIKELKRPQICIYLKVYAPFNRNYNVRVLKMPKFPDRPSRFVLSW